MKRILFSLFLGGLSIPILARGTQPNLFRTAAESIRMDQWVDSVFYSLRFEERVGQLFMPMADINFTQKSETLLNRCISEMGLGGILFQRGTARFQAELCNRLQDRSKVPMMISLDGEWGLAMRITDAPRYLRNMPLGAIRNTRLIESYGREVGRQCREMGIHINFAPALDVNSNPLNPVIGTRSFGENPTRVSEAGLAYSRGLESQGVLACAKHFPGHGDSSDDSHYRLPLINRSNAELEKVEFRPFRDFIRAGFSSVMVGHLNIPALEPDTIPSSFSPRIVTQLLSQQMGFYGLIVTDGLAMKGAVPRYSKCIDALLAGNDVLLAMDDPIDEYQRVLNAVRSGLISEDLINERCRKVLQYKFIVGLNRYRPIRLDGLEARLHTPSAEMINRETAAAAITLLKNRTHKIPLQELDANTSILQVGTTTLCENNFAPTLRRYFPYDLLSIEEKYSTSSAIDLLHRLSSKKQVIVSIHNDTPELIALTDSLTRLRSDLILCFFISPYRAAAFDRVISKALSVVMAYENHPFAHQYAAQAIVGGIGVNGRLPVRMGSLYTEGNGMVTRAIRLQITTPESVGINSDSLGKIDSLCHEAIVRNATPGCQILVARRGAIIYNRSFGSQTYPTTTGNDTPIAVTDSTIYDLASLTKAMGTTLAVMRLYDQGKLRLNDPISRFLPKSRGTQVGNLTIASLLHHTSGLPAMIPFWQDAVKIGALHRNPPASPSACIGQNSYVLRTFRAEMLNKIIRTSIHPNQRPYGDPNFILLGRIVEQICHQSLETYLRKEFYEPLGASSTGFLPLNRFPLHRIAPTELDPNVRRGLVHGYVHDESSAVGGGVEGNAGLFSTAGDLATIAQMLLNGGTYGGHRYLSESTVQLFFSTRSSINARALGFDAPNPKNRNSSPVPLEAPNSVVGHLGFTGTCLWIDPDNQLIYIFLSNRVYPNRTPNQLSALLTRKNIHSAIYQSIAK